MNKSMVKRICFLIQFAEKNCSRIKEYERVLTEQKCAKLNKKQLLDLEIKNFRLEDEIDHLFEENVINEQKYKYIKHLIRQEWNIIDKWRKKF